MEFYYESSTSNRVGQRLRKPGCDGPLPVRRTTCIWWRLPAAPGWRSPHWAIPRPYQPTSRVWEPRVIGSTNPIWVDGDGDGKFTPARAYAKSLIQQYGTEPARLLTALATCDEA